MDANQARELVGANLPPDFTTGLLAELVRIPTPQTARFEAEPLIQEFVRDWARPRLSALGLGTPRLDRMGSLLLTVGPPDGDPGLLLVSYAMVPQPGAMADPYSAAIVDGTSYGLEGPCLWGRGAAEQKGPMAAMWSVLEAVRRSGVRLRRPLHFAISTAGETGRHDAVRTMMEELGPSARWGIVGLGQGNRICLANKGRLDVEVVVRGRAAHSSTPWEGANAIDGMRRVMDRLDGFRVSEHPRLGPATLTKVRLVSEPDATHTVQGECRLVLDRRLLPGDDPEGALAELRSLVGTLAGFAVEVRPGPLMYPSEIGEDSELVVALQAAAGAVAGRRLGTVISHSCLDAGYLNRRGIETVMFGPGEPRFVHTVQEVVRLAEVHEAADILSHLALTLLA